MDVNITKRLSRSDWLNAMGVKGEADSSLIDAMDEAEELLLGSAKPKAVYRVAGIEDIKIEGYSLRKHLEGCRKVGVMALTLGIGVDNMLRKMQLNDMAAAVIADTGASLLTDSLCDDFESYIKENAAEKYSTGRFSPGYGDYPLENQRDLVAFVDGQRKIGLTVTADFMMVPRKSVTALIGFADHPVTGRPATCDECVLKDKCTLRKDGKFCGDRL